MPHVTAAAPAPHTGRIPYARCVLVGLGGLFAGVTGPLLSTFVPLIVSGVLGENRSAIGAVMAIDNVLLLALVPVAGVLSDRAVARGGSRLPLVVASFAVAAIGMAVLPLANRFGLAGIILAMVLLYGGINLQRSPLQALVADLLPSGYRSLGMASVTFQMCVGAIVFLMLGRALGMRTAFFIAAFTVLAIAALVGLFLRGTSDYDAPAGTLPPSPPASPEPEASATSLATLARAGLVALRGDLPGVRAIFLSALLLQLTFQAFTTWFALHGTERFHVSGEDVSLGFIAWAIGGVIGALPAGMLGMRLGRRRTMMVGFVLMTASLVALDRVQTLTQATPLLVLASASWSLPSVNAYPMFMEPLRPEQRGVLAALFLLCMALGGAIGDPLNGRLFDAAGGYRPLFLLMATYTALALVAVALVPRGTGEAPVAGPTVASR